MTWAARSGLVAVACWASSRAVMAVPLEHSHSTPLWPAAGIALAALVLWGSAMLPAVAVASFVTAFAYGPTTAVGAGVGAAYVLAPWVASVLLRRTGFDPRLQRLEDAVRLVVVAATSMTIAASIGTWTLALAGSPLRLGTVWLTWWSGATLGVLLFTPVVLCVPAVLRSTRWQVVELTAILAALVETSHIGFYASAPMRFLVFPFIVLAAVRFQVVGAAFAALVPAITGVVAASHGQGWFGSTDPLRSLLNLQLFNVTVALTCYLLAAVTADRARMRRRLEQRSERSEAHEAERTVQLAHSERRLAEAQAIAQIGSWDWDVSNDRVEWSEELFRLMGLRPDPAQPLTPRSYLERIHPDDRDHVSEVLVGALLAGGSFHHDHRVVRPDGRVRWLHSQGQVVMDSRHRAVAMKGTATDITDRKAQEARLEHLVLHDALTGLPNRVLLTDRLSRAISSTAGTRTAVLFCDLDRFKWVNDSLGHASGDAVLREVASRVCAAVGPLDTVARFGGDELVVICPDLDSDEAAQRIAEGVRLAVRRPIHLADGHSFLPTLSIGIATTADPTTTPAAMLRDADAAMYLAKEQGRDRVRAFVPDAHQVLSTRLGLAVDLRSALEQGTIGVAYQPVMSLRTGAVVGFEALARWRHPQLGPIAPEVFVDLAEDTGQIEALDRHVILTAAREFGRLHSRQAEARGLGLAVNVSLRHLSTPRLRETLVEALALSGLAPKSLCVEVTETADLAGDDLADLLRMVKDLGLRVAIDDFGTGFSALSRLRGLAVDTIKVDRSFVATVHSSPRSRALVAAMAQLARALDAQIIAEGVESASQRDVLAEVGCHDAQGFIWSEALPIDLVDRWLCAAGARVPSPRLPFVGEALVLP